MAETPQHELSLRDFFTLFHASFLDINYPGFFHIVSCTILGHYLSWGCSHCSMHNYWTLFILGFFHTVSCIILEHYLSWVFSHYSMHNSWTLIILGSVFVIHIRIVGIKNNNTITIMNHSSRPNYLCVKHPKTLQNYEILAIIIFKHFFHI